MAEKIVPEIGRGQVVRFLQYSGKYAKEMSLIKKLHHGQTLTVTAVLDQMPPAFVCEAKDGSNHSLYSRDVEIQKDSSEEIRD